ncbi:hypothetical protein P7K49_018075 [Saguinus oedipus]|uniref:IF rod domain-containing protein n=1 Tax=Saguinus oedipus TaxID=9490 RepID=A0ABQ9V4C7_SAGOE|nr:hypothetical protein P7K49_018075 [Saguinus oedipus]
MRKNHEEELKCLQAQIFSSGLTMEVDAPKLQDLAKNMADIWAQYDELTQKNREELDNPVLRDRPGLHEKSEDQIGEQSEGGGGLLHSADGAAQQDPATPGVRAGTAWAEGQHQAQEYKALLNIKVKLEAEIATYHHLLKDGEDFNLGDALDSKPFKRPPPAG